jgi:hypothetical protein
VLRIQIRRIYLFLGLPDPDPLVRGTDPVLHDFRSRSFQYHAKIVRKTLIPTVLWLRYDFLSLKNDLIVASKCNNPKNLNNFFAAVLKVTDFNSRIWSRIWSRIRIQSEFGSDCQRCGSVPNWHGSTTLFLIRKTLCNVIYIPYRKLMSWRIRRCQMTTDCSAVRWADSFPSCSGSNQSLLSPSQPRYVYVQTGQVSQALLSPNTPFVSSMLSRGK